MVPLPVCDITWFESWRSHMGLDCFPKKSQNLGYVLNRECNCCWLSVKCVNRWFYNLGNCTQYVYALREGRWKPLPWLMCNRFHSDLIALHISLTAAVACVVAYYSCYFPGQLAKDTLLCIVSYKDCPGAYLMDLLGLKSFGRQNISKLKNYELYGLHMIP